MTLRSLREDFFTKPSINNTYKKNIHNYPYLIKGVAFIKRNVLTSSRIDETSCWYNEKKNGMFTYFFLEAIHGKNADFNNDNKISLNEIYQYVSDNSSGVPYYARRIHGNEQNPIIYGQNKDRVLIRY